MAGRRGLIAVLSAVIALLLSGAVAGLARTEVGPVDVSAGAGLALPEAAAEPGVTVETAAALVEVAGAVVEAPPPAAAAPVPSTTTTGAPAAPSPSTTVPGRPKAGDHRDQPRGPSEVGSVSDLGPGPVETTVPSPCTPSSQTTAPHAVAVVELSLGCVRPLVPAGTWAGPEVSWSPDGSWLLTTVQGRVVRLARDGSWRQDLGGGGQARFAVMSPDGGRIAVGGSVPQGNLRQQDVLVVAAADGTGGAVIEMRVMRPPSWSPDSQVLAVVGSEGDRPRPDVVTVVGADGRVRATRSFPNRSLFGINDGPLTPGPALLGQPLFLPDGRLFQPAFIEIPGRATGLWLTRALTDAGGLEPPDDLNWSLQLSAPADGSSIVYTAGFTSNTLSSPIRRVDLRTGQTVTLAAAGAAPSSSHRTNAVAFFSRNTQGTGQGVSVVDATGVDRLAWHHSGTNCTCLDGGQPAWTTDDAAIAVAIGTA